MEEKIKVSILFGIYGNILTKTQKKYMQSYYNEDLSLSEIGENEGITRQAVKAILDKSTKKLYEFEEKLSFMKKQKSIKLILKKLEEINLKTKQKKYIKEIYKKLDI